MYLHDKNNEQINIYSLIPNKKKIYEYKKEKMEKIPFEKRVFTAKTNDYHCLEILRDYIWDIDLQNEKSKLYGECAYHKLISYNTLNKIEKQEILLEKYYNNDMTHSGKIFKIYRSRKNYDINNLLLCEPYYKEEIYSEGVYSMEDIINIPDSLYNFEMFDRKKFNLIKHENFEELLKLYDINLMTTFNINDAEKIYSFEIKHEDLVNLDNSKKILKFIKNK